MTRLFLFALFTACSLGMCTWAATVTENPDGTRKSTYTAEDEAKKDVSQAYDPYRRAPGDSAKDYRVRSKENDLLFPEEQKKRAQKALDRAAMTEEQKEHEQRMLDRTPSNMDKVNPTLKERNSIPKRF